MYNIKILGFYFTPLQNVSCNDIPWEWFLCFAWSQLCYMDTLGILIGRKAISRVNMIWKCLFPLLRKIDSKIFPSIVCKYCPFILFFNHIILTVKQSTSKSKSNLFSYLTLLYNKIIYDRLKLCILPLQ